MKNREDKGQNGSVDFEPLLVRHPVSGKVIPVEWFSAVRVGKDLERDLRELPAKMAWFVSLRSVAAEEVRQAKDHEEAVNADVYISTREGLSEVRDAKKLTESEIKNVAKANPKLREASRLRMEAENRLKKLESVCELLIEKRWTLMSLVKLRVAEMGSGLGDS